MRLNDVREKYEHSTCEEKIRKCACVCTAENLFDKIEDLFDKIEDVFDKTEVIVEEVFGFPKRLFGIPKTLFRKTSSIYCFGRAAPNEIFSNRASRL